MRGQSAFTAIPSGFSSSAIPSTHIDIPYLAMVYATGRRRGRKEEVREREREGGSRRGRERGREGVGEGEREGGREEEE